MKEIHVEAGENVHRACERLAKAAPACMVFNEIRVEAVPGDTAIDLFKRWSAEWDRLVEKYTVTAELRDLRRVLSAAEQYLADSTPANREALVTAVVTIARRAG